MITLPLFNIVYIFLNERTTEAHYGFCILNMNSCLTFNGQYRSKNTFGCIMEV